MLSLQVVVLLSNHFCVVPQPFFGVPELLPKHHL